MDYLTILKEGHAAGRRKLAILSQLAGRIEAGEDLDRLVPLLREVTTFFDNELYVHFRQEEIALFPALISAVGRAGVVSAMIEEHQSIWKAIDNLEEAGGQLESVIGDERKKVANTVKMIARHIGGLLGAHIEKEDSMLFPLAQAH